MTRLLVLSDSHGAMGQLLPLLPWQEADMILFAGDGYDEAQAAFRHLGIWDRVVAVAGNCDGRPAFAEAEFEVAGQAVWLTHGDRWGVKGGYATIAAEARRRGVDLVVFGHSHVPVHVALAGVHLFNPGSPVEPRGGSQASVGWIEATPEALQFRHLPV